MGFLSRLFRQNHEVTRTAQGDRQVLADVWSTIQGDHQVFRTDVWRVDLPLIWAPVPSSLGAISFETPDKAKQINITTYHLDPGASVKIPDVAKQLQESGRNSLAGLEGYKWVLLQDDQVPTSNGCIATLDAHDPQRRYRICTKAIVQPFFAIRAAFHDFDCKSTAESRAYFAPLIESLKVNGAKS
jgi:hypothetical protein